MHGSWWALPTCSLHLLLMSFSIIFDSMMWLEAKLRHAILDTFFQLIFDRLCFLDRKTNENGAPAKQLQGEVCECEKLSKSKTPRRCLDAGGSAVWASPGWRVGRGGTVNR